MTLANSAEEVHGEVEAINALALEAKAVEDSLGEAKLSRLRELLQQEGFFSKPDQRLLIFTEFTDTLYYLIERLKEWGFRVGYIHGGMKPGSREEQGTRLFAEQQFREGEIQVLVATEAAGEGINLQVCHILFNYDIPWNPNRLEQRMGRIHRYGQIHDCLIFNFVATNTIEGKILRKLYEKLQEIRNALEDDAVFNVVGEVLPAAQVERILREYYAGKLGQADLEDRLLKNIDEKHFRDICQNALEGLASKKLNLEMLIERRALAQERRVVPETIARFLQESAGVSGFAIKLVPAFPHTFDPSRTPTVLKRYESDEDWRMAAVAARYPRLSTDRDTAERHSFEWVTPGHPLFESLRRHSLHAARDHFGRGACFYSLQHSSPARLDFYRARVVDGTGHVIHERLFAIELGDGVEPILREPGYIGNLTPTGFPGNLPMVASTPEAIAFLNERALDPFLQGVRAERLAEIDRVADHVELSLTELIQKADEEIGKAGTEVDQKAPGAEGRLAQAEERHQKLLDRRDRRRVELDRQRALTLQNVERLASALILPHPERDAPEVRRLQPDFETEATAMRVVIGHEKSLGRQVFDVHEKNLGYDVTSLDLSSGQLRLIEVKGIGGKAGAVLLTPNERRVAEDRRDCYWLYVVTDCNAEAKLEDPIRDPARFPWHEVKKVDHYWLDVDALKHPMEIRDSPEPR